MKTKYSLLLAIPLALAACQSEPEVGETLYPSTPETTEAKVYINETALPGNQHVTDVLRTPYGIQASADTVSFYVRINKPVATDVTVTVSQVDSLATGYGSDATPLAAQFVDGVNMAVTIPAGSMVSASPVRVALKNLDDLQASGVAPLAISAVQGEAVAASDHNVYYMAVDYSETASRVKSQSTADLKGLNVMDGYTVSVDGELVSRLYDGKYNTYYSPETPGGYEVVVDLGSKQPLAAVAFHWGYQLGYCPTSVELLTSNDGVNWESISDGYVNLASIPNSRQTACPFVLYQPVYCSYVKLRLGDCSYGVEYGEEYNYPTLSEVKVYK